MLRCAMLTETAKREGWPAMHARLMAVDPATANRLAPNDSQRIQRALEVYEVAVSRCPNGKPKSIALRSRNVTQRL